MLEPAATATHAWIIGWRDECFTKESQNRSKCISPTISILLYIYFVVRYVVYLHLNQLILFLLTGNLLKMTAAHVE